MYKVKEILDLFLYLILIFVLAAVSIKLRTDFLKHEVYELPRSISLKVVYHRWLIYKLGEKKAVYNGAFQKGEHKKDKFCFQTSKVLI